MHNQSLKSFNDFELSFHRDQVICMSSKFMPAIHTHKIKALFILVPLMLALPCFSQEKMPVISSSEHLKMLNEYKSKADAYCAKNLNRFGLDELQKYDKT